MDPKSKRLLEGYKNNALKAENTEGVENSIIREATRLEDRAKWQKMLAEDGIQRTAHAESAEQPDEEPQKTVVKKGIVRTLAPYLVGLAAALAFLVMFVLRTNESFDAAIAMNRFPAVEVRLGANLDIETWKKAMEAYKKNNFAESARLIATISEPNSGQKLYLALSYLYQEPADYEKAGTLFSNLADARDPLYEEEARWFLAYSLFKSNKTAEAKEILQQIVAKKAYNHKKATVILKKEF